MYYNFGRIHKTLRVTLAMAAGLTDHVWSLEEIALLALGGKPMKTRKVILVVAQVAISFIAAAYAVKTGTPYVALAPLSWWQSVLRWPWSLAFRLGGATHLFVVMLALFAVYSAMVFLILRYLIVKPIFGGERAN